MRQFLKSLSLALLTLTGAGSLASGGPNSPQHHVWPPSQSVAKSRPFQKPAKAAPVTVVVEEDFSAFTTGSEQSPDPVNILEGSYQVPENLTKQPGWTGGGLHSAGGAVALMAYEDYGYSYPGFISTPLMELFGEVTISFRAKRAANSEGNIWVALCDDYDGPVDRMDCPLSDQWQEFTMVSDKATFNDYNNVQIATTGGDALVDDVKIQRVANRLPAPYANPTVNNSLESFTCTWDSVGNATHYLLTVFSRELPEGLDADAGSISFGFDGLPVNADGKTIDASQPYNAEGWEINVSSRGSQDVATTDGNFGENAPALVFDQAADQLISPVTPLPITEISFWVKPTFYDEEENGSLLGVMVLSNGEWVHIANLPNYWMEEEGGRYYFDAEQIGMDATCLKLEMTQKDICNFIVDDIEISYEPRPVPVSLLTDVRVEGVNYTVDNIVPEKDYYWYVKAANGEEIVSNPSATVWADGLNGLAPEVLEPTNISPDGFTANWKPMPHADGYEVNLTRTTVAQADMFGVEVIAEDFAGITEGTLDNPCTSWQNIDLAKEGMTRLPWQATQPQWCEGMIGSTGTSWMGTAGLVVSPRLSLGNNGGAFDVEADVYAQQPGDVIFVMVLNALTDTQAISSDAIQTPEELGVYHATAHVAEGGADDVLVAFMSMSGKGFFVGNVTISQNLHAGERLTRPYDMAMVDKVASCSFEALPADTEYGYSVTARAMREYEDYVSLPSETMTVNLATSGLEIPVVEASESEGPAEYFNLQGSRVVSPSAGLYLRRSADGTVSKIIVR